MLTTQPHLALVKERVGLYRFSPSGSSLFVRLHFSPFKTDKRGSVSVQGSIFCESVIIHDTFLVLVLKCGVELLAVDVQLDCQRVVLRH